MIVTLAKEFKFDAAHHLDFLPEGHKCRRMHGHTYRVEVAITGDAGPQGFLIDYAEIAAIVEPLVERLDHRVLNELYALSAPTTENVVQWFLYLIAEKLWTPTRTWILKVRVSESSSTYAESSITLNTQFWRCEDNGEHYDFVALGQEHAAWLLRHCGMETIADADKAYGTDRVEWVRLAPEQAALVMCNTEDDRGRVPLSSGVLGDWFTTCV